MALVNAPYRMDRKTLLITIGDYCSNLWKINSIGAIGPQKSPEQTSS